MNTYERLKEAVLAAEAEIEANAFLWWPDQTDSSLSRKAVAMSLQEDLRSTPEGRATYRRRANEAAKKRRVFDTMYPSERRGHRKL